MKHPIIQQLRMERRLREMSQEAVSAFVDKSQHCISDYERGFTAPCVHTLDKWAAALGYDLVLKKKGEK